MRSCRPPPLLTSRRPDLINRGQGSLSVPWRRLPESLRHCGKFADPLRIARAGDTTLMPLVRAPAAATNRAGPSAHHRTRAAGREVGTFGRDHRAVPADFRSAARPGPDHQDALATRVSIAQMAASGDHAARFGRCSPLGCEMRPITGHADRPVQYRPADGARGSRRGGGRSSGGVRRSAAEIGPDHRTR